MISGPDDLQNSGTSGQSTRGSGAHIGVLKRVDLHNSGTSGPGGQTTRDHNVILKRSDLQNSTTSGPGKQGTHDPSQPKGILKRSDLQNSGIRGEVPHHQTIQKGQSYSWLQNEETRQSFSPHQSRVTIMNQDDEDQQEDDRQVDSPLTETDMSDYEHECEENIGSTSHGTTKTRKESRVLGETRNGRLNKRKLVFEVDECSGRIVGEDSQRFITKGGCVMRKVAKFDGTTWRNQDHLLKMDIITKCTENSNYDPNCDVMEYAMQRQLGNQHKNKQYKLHKYFKTFPTKEEAMKHLPKNIKTNQWVNLCERFASEEFQKISTKNKKNRSFNKIPPTVGTVSIARRVDMKTRGGEEVTAIENFKIGHFSERKNAMVNETTDEILKELQHEEATSTCIPAEICLKILHHIPGYIKGSSTSTRKSLGTGNMGVSLQIERERSNALEKVVHVMKDRQLKLEEENTDIKRNMEFMMKEISRLSKLQKKRSKKTRVSMQSEGIL